VGSADLTWGWSGCSFVEEVVRVFGLSTRQGIKFFAELHVSWVSASHGVKEETQGCILL
jgi:hypothetical protein